MRDQAKGIAKEGGKPALVPLKSELGLLREAWKAKAGEIGKLEGQAREIKGTLENLARKSEGLSKAIAGNRACPECGQKVSIAHLSNKQSDLIKEHHSLEKRYEHIEEKIKSESGLLTKIENNITKLEKKTEKISECELEVNSLEKELKLIQAQENPHAQRLDTLQEQLISSKDHLKALEERSEEAEVKKGIYEYWNTSFKEIRLTIIDDVLMELEMACTKHAEALGLSGWRMEFKTERETKSGNVSLSFTTLLYPPDQGEPIRFESYSGGESQRLQLAAAFGLSEVLLERAGVIPNMEILDEPTKGLSAEGVEDLLSHLGDRARGNRRSIFFVDHHSLDKGHFDDVVTIIKDSKGANIR